MSIVALSFSALYLLEGAALCLVRVFLVWYYSIGVCVCVCVCVCVFSLSGTAWASKDSAKYSVTVVYFSTFLFSMKALPKRLNLSNCKNKQQ